jgi:hypothetical protein
MLPALAPPLAVVAPAMLEVPPLPPSVAAPPSSEPVAPALGMPPPPLAVGEPGGSDGVEHAAERTANATTEESAPERAGRDVNGIPLS